MMTTLPNNGRLICEHCVKENTLDTPLISFGVTKDLKTEKMHHQPVQSFLICECSSGENVIYLVNQEINHINRIKYRVKDMDGLYTGMVDQGWVAFRFTSPKHLLLLHFQVPPKCKRFKFDFMRPLEYFLKRKMKSLDKTFDPKISDYISLKRFDRFSMDAGSLSTLILEDVIVPSLTECIGQSPISYISLSRSKIGTSQLEPNNFWDWMSEDIVCNNLTVLELNSIGLEKLPLEIIFLKKLTTLSLSTNKLTVIPHYIGELKKLENFFIDNNKLKYLPECLQTRVFKSINFTDNKFKEFNDLVVANGLEREEPESYSSFLFSTFDDEPASNRIEDMFKRKVCGKLSHLSLFSLINNCMKFKRQDLSLDVVKSFDLVYRCNACHKLMIPTTKATYDRFYIRSHLFIDNMMICWEYFKCEVCSINYSGNVFKNLSLLPI